MDKETGKKPGKLTSLDKMVAISVVILSVFMAVAKVKDDNIVQAMQKAKADSVDAWAEYQASRLKFIMAEHTIVMLRVVPQGGSNAQEIARAEEITRALAAQEKDIVHYGQRAKDTMAKAKGLEELYNDLNFKDDQFDLSDVFTSIAIALAAVAALTDMWAMLFIAWISGGTGIALGLAAFMNWGLRFEWLINLLG